MSIPRGVSEDTMATVETVQSILRVKGNQVWSIAPEATVFEALSLMAEKSIGAVVVISAGLPVGVLSERDYARKVFLKGKSSRETLVAEIMTSPVKTVEPQTTVLECMQLMTRMRLRHLPVIEQGRLAGIVSIGDLVNSILTAQAQTIQQLRNYVTGEYPA